MDEAAVSVLKFTGEILLRGINPYVLVSAERAGRIKLRPACPGRRKGARDWNQTD
jgi:hypothetical protein